MVVGTLIAVGQPAHADPRHAPSTLSDTEVRARIAYLEGVLVREAPAARLWHRGWFWGYAGLTVGEGAVALAARPNSGLRLSAAVGSAKSALGFFAVVFAPSAASTADAKLRAAPERTAAERRAKLRLAERLLKKSAEQQRFGHSWFPQVGAAIVNLAGAYVLWLGYRRFSAGWISLASGMAVSELQYFTQPTQAIDAWSAYRAGRFTEPRVAPRVSFTVLPFARGLCLNGVF